MEESRRGEVYLRSCNRNAYVENGRGTMDGACCAVTSMLRHLAFHDAALPYRSTST